MGANALASDCALECAADGVDIAAEGERAVQFSEDGEEVGDDAFGFFFFGLGVGGGEEGVPVDDGADAVVQAFVMGVEGWEYGVVWEGGDTFCEGGAEEGGLVGVAVSGVVVEEVGEVLVEEFEGGVRGWREEGEVGFVGGLCGGEGEVGGEVGEKDEEGHGEDCGSGVVEGEKVVTRGGEGLLGISLGTGIDAG